MFCACLEFFVWLLVLPILIILPCRWICVVVHSGKKILTALSVNCNLLCCVLDIRIRNFFTAPTLTAVWDAIGYAGVFLVSEEFDLWGCLCGPGRDVFVFCQKSQGSVWQLFGSAT